VPCFGFVFEERGSEQNTRRVVILGDTSDPSAIRQLAQNADVLVHESTLAYVPPTGEKNLQKYAPNVIHEKAVKRGHSTAEMAGQFAKSINARILALNHFSAR
jgi:ribonuclease Z